MKKKKKTPQSSIGKYFAELQQEQNKKLDLDNEPRQENKHSIHKNKKAKK